MRFETSPIRSGDLRDGARGQLCKIQLAGVCIGGTETTVLAHLPSAPHGMALKGDDLVAVEACCACHDAMLVIHSYNNMQARQSFTRESA